jgi:hypothetical protein
LGKPSAVLGLDGVGIRPSLGPCDQNAIGESLYKSVRYSGFQSIMRKTYLFNTVA